LTTHTEKKARVRKKQPRAEVTQAGYMSTRRQVIIIEPSYLKKCRFFVRLTKNTDRENGFLYVPGISHRMGGDTNILLRGVLK
jgi:hypothetical protein